MDVSKLFFSVALPTPNEPYFAINKGFYDAIFADDPALGDSFKYGEIPSENPQYVIVLESSADNDFQSAFGDYWGEFKSYSGGFSTIENYQG